MLVNCLKIAKYNKQDIPSLNFNLREASLWIL